MVELFQLILGVLASLFKSRARLEAENLVLRQPTAFRRPSAHGGGNRFALRRRDENGWHRDPLQDNVDWRVAGLLAAGSVPATVLTISVLSRVPKQSPTTSYSPS
jgi:hypothetical protein